MNVLNMTGKVLFTPNPVLPKASLPNGLFMLLLSRYGSWGLALIFASSAKRALDQTPTIGEIAIVLRQCPNAVQMVREQDEGIDLERMISHDLLKDLP
jgi:hypothetical protein